MFAGDLLKLSNNPVKKGQPKPARKGGSSVLTFLLQNWLCCGLLIFAG
jgi:hypothetical protein